MDPHFLNLTMMQSFRTGNIILDLLAAAMIPILFASIWNYASRYWSDLLAWVSSGAAKDYVRSIHYQKTSPFHNHSTNSNQVLQHAVRTYMGTQLKRDFIRGKVKLTELKSTASANNNDNDSDSDYDSDDGKKADAAPAGNFRILDLPNSAAGRVMIEPGLYFQESTAMSQDDDENPGDNKQAQDKIRASELVYSFSSPGHGGQSGKQVVDGFLDRVLKWFLAEVAKREDQSRWMYQPLVTERFLTKSKARIYKRYRLSSEKTFSSLFFPQKEKIMKMLDVFEKKTGKYQIKGFPHKLGLLLHGPPGTGKTSLVKAIATHTKRHIVSIPLSRIHTNQELLDVMFDCEFKYCTGKGNDDDEPKTKAEKLSHGQIVFLLEDVDAASSVVHARTAAINQSTMMRNASEVLTREYTSTDMGGAEECGEDDSGDAPQLDAVKSGSKGSRKADGKAPEAAGSDAIKSLQAQNAQIAEMMQMMMHQQQQQAKNTQAMLQKSKGSASKGGNDAATGGDDFVSIKADDFLLPSDKDKLSLDGLLTVLDGVVDTPGRILVMTTNHPEKLDPALLRPGRINICLYLGFLLVDDLRKMVRHYYADATEAELNAITKIFSERCDRSRGEFKLTPAEFEQMCAESSTIADLKTRLQTSAIKRR